MAGKKRVASTGVTNAPRKYASHKSPEFQHLICLICEGVYVDPVTTACSSEHYFCRGCITNWIKRSPTCPIDRSSLTIDALKPAPRILSDILAALHIRCRYHVFGCRHSLPDPQALAAHVLTCGHRCSALLDHDYLCRPTTEPEQPPVSRTEAAIRAAKATATATVAAGGDGGCLFRRPKFDPRSCFS